MINNAVLVLLPGTALQLVKQLACEDTKWPCVSDKGCQDSACNSHVFYSFRLCLTSVLSGGDNASDVRVEG